MYVNELRKQLEQYPDDLWIDIMFPDGCDCYQIATVSDITLSQGEKRVIIDIVNETPLKAV